ncbi:GNAT family N-acetyltransferase [Mesorhizobium sp. ZC-5]|uniref:GNAT family N-acetyltransferase n=1 Tax=Mesorhizobium sp. ZC-5 TaxID=2986066 RepID=UPI0021E83872|nr:GNAT family N-acetyltransferase [Mesorhizobium sp. ZC-5]MCV3241316.1 GNAT family N-acetyltransferase [Mesorhizobium sp. ZC-5]
MAKDHTASLAIRLAQRADLEALIEIFAADDVGGHGDTNNPDALPAYQAAFDRIAANPFDTLYVAELDGVVVGTFQMTLGTSLASRGASYLTIGAVQTRADKRGLGIGAEMMRYAIERGREAGAMSIKLTSNNDRGDAHRFYKRLGFKQSHAGFKMKLRD